MTASEKMALESRILRLLAENEKISLRQVAGAVGLSAESAADRRAIQRALAKLIKQADIRVEGRARARVYVLNKRLTNLPEILSPVENEKGFEGIALSSESISLLQYLSQPIQLRQSVGYQREFLVSYKPNQTYYLTDIQREELFSVGKVESAIRPAGTYARNILNRLLIDLSWNSSRLEGNTYSILETKRLIECGESAAGKDAFEAQMILNHKDAIEYIIDSADETKISAHEICSIHALLSENLLGDPSASGRLRQIAVGISGTTYHPIDNPHLLKEMFEMYVQKMNLIQDPFEQSFFSLVHLSYLQAFEDVNKRTARLAANIPLIKKNLKPLSFIDVNQADYVRSLLGVYEKNDVSLMRDLYVWAYKKSSQQYSAIQQSMGEPNVFKLKYRDSIQSIVRSIILETISGDQVVPAIQQMVRGLKLSKADADQLFHVIEIELMSLHEGNIARYKLRPSEYQKWEKLK